MVERYSSSSSSKSGLVDTVKDLMYGLFTVKKSPDKGLFDASAFASTWNDQELDGDVLTISKKLFEELEGYSDFQNALTGNTKRYDPMIGFLVKNGLLLTDTYQLVPCQNGIYKPNDTLVSSTFTSSGTLYYATSSYKLPDMYRYTYSVLTPEEDDIQNHQFRDKIAYDLVATYINESVKKITSMTEEERSTVEFLATIVHLLEYPEDVQIGLTDWINTMEKSKWKADLTDIDEFTTGRYHPKAIALLHKILKDTKQGSQTLYDVLRVIAKQGQPTSEQMQEFYDDHWLPVYQLVKRILYTYIHKSEIGGGKLNVNGL